MPYVGDGQTRWAAAHVGDVARVYRLAFERQEAARYHAVAEEGVPAKAIAEMLGRGLNLPVKSITMDEAPNYFGWMSAFVGMDLSASSDWTKKTLDWRPTGPGLLADLDAMNYEAAA